METRFTRTERAAEVMRESPWDVIEAIGLDAAEQDWPISGIETRSEAKKALVEAGLTADTVKDATVKGYCITAKYLMESTAQQRPVFRRYAWSAVLRFAKAGWSQEATYDALKGAKRKRYAEIMALTRGDAGARSAPRTLDDMAREVLARANAFFREAASFMETFEKVSENVDASGHAALTYRLCRDQMERRFDRELREILEGEQV